ncbi:MAG: ABC transporter permease [Acidobacteria bacterium]|nr:ABC transporter permease [Acidobacteriota bacterium]
MEFGPIVRSLFHNKTRFWLVTLEIALTLALVINCAVYILDMGSRMIGDTGMDIENILVVHTEPVSPDFKDEEFVNQVRDEDLRLLAAQPGVLAAAAFQQIPLSGSGSSTSRRAEGSELNTIPAPYYLVTLDAIQTLGVELEAGRNLLASDYPPAGQDDIRDDDGVQRFNVLVTRSFADKLYPDGDALGKAVVNSDNTSVQTIVGIIKHMNNSWPRSEFGSDVILFPLKAGSAERMRYLVRTRPGALDDLSATLEEKMLAANPDRIITLTSLAEVKADTFSEDVALVKIFSGVIVLLFVVTSLGIFGLASFSVTERTRQIGTRRALGATRAAILRYFLVETWVITGIGLTLGTGMAFGLNMVLATVADSPRLELPLLLTGIVVFWLVGMLAALVPAMRAMLVPPVLATRTI